MSNPSAIGKSRHQNTSNRNLRKDKKDKSKNKEDKTELWHNSTDYVSTILMARNDGTVGPEVIIFVCCNHLNVNYDDKKYCTTIQIMSVQMMAQNDGTGGGEVIILSAATI